MFWYSRAFCSTGTTWIAKNIQDFLLLLFFSWWRKTRICSKSYGGMSASKHPHSLLLIGTEFLLSEIISKDGVKCRFCAEIHDCMFPALGNLQLFLWCGGMIDACLSVKCHNHIILNLKSQVIKLVFSLWPCICGDFLLLNLHVSQRWRHVGSWPPSAMITFSFWSISAFDFINLIMRGRGKAIFITHQQDSG